jgi:hypothetical protein
MQDWLPRIKATMAVDLSRFMTAGLPPKAIIERLFDMAIIYLRKQMRLGKWFRDRPALTRSDIEYLRSLGLRRDVALAVCPALVARLKCSKGFEDAFANIHKLFQSLDDRALLQHGAGRKN